MVFDWNTFWGWLCEVFSKDGAPAWVQAAGSLLALWIAIKVSKTPIDHAAAVKRKTIFAIAEAAHAHARNIRKALDQMIWLAPDGNYHIHRVYHPSVIDGVVKALQGIPMHELGSGKDVLAMLSLTGQLVFLRAAVDALLAGPAQHPEIAKVLASLSPDDHEMRLKLCATGFTALQGNVRTHLNQIDGDFEILKEGLK